MSGGLDGGVLLARVRDAAGRQAARRRQIIADGIEADFPELQARIEGEAVVVEGRDLLVRWLNEARLRDALSGAMGGGRR